MTFLLRLAVVFVFVFSVVGRAADDSSGANPPKEDLDKLKRDLVKIDQSIEVTRQKMKEVKDVTFLPDLYFVLAELSVEKSRYLSAIKRMESPSTPIKELDFFEAKKAKREAIETYQRFIETFPKHEYVDKALFYMAHEYRELGLYEDMIRTYARLTHDFPKSPLYAETQVIVGDFLLEEKKDPKGALEVYQRVLAGAQTPFMPIARYKTGWCYINLDKFHEALLAFEGVLTVDAGVDLDKLPDLYKKSDIRRDALLAMVWPYSEEKKLDAYRADALTYFEKLSPNRVSYVKVLDKLTKRVMIKHKIDQALPAYFKLIELTNTLDMRLEYFERMYEAIRVSRKSWPIERLPEPLTDTILRMRYDAELGAKEKAKYEKNFEIYLRDFTTKIHKRAKTTHRESDYLVAAQAYERYLEVYPRAKFAPALQLDLAESYFNAKRWALAGLAYENLVKQARAPKKSLMDSAIQSYAYALKLTPDKTTKLELTQSRYGFREMGVRFLKAFPQDPASAMIRFNVARTYYDERDFDNAVKGFMIFINAHPTHKEMVTAGNLILDAYNQREDYDGLIKAGKQLIANPRIQNKQFKSDVSEIVRQAEYRKVRNVAGDPKNREYAQTMLKFASKYQGTTLGDTALFEAYSALKAKKDPQMYEPGEQLLLKHKDSKYAREVVAGMGQMAVTTADYRRAAQYFEMFARKYPNEPNGKGLLKNAANMRELMGDIKEAADDYRDLNMRDMVAHEYALAQDWTNLAQVLSGGGVHGLRNEYWMGLSLTRTQHFDQARPFLAQAARSRAGNYEEKKMAAHALYLLASDAMKAYENIQLAGDASDTANTKAKVARLQSLEGQLNRVISLGNGRWTIAALYQLGRVNDDMAKFLASAQAPGGLTPAQAAQYKQLIDQQVGSFKGKAKTYFAACIKNAEKFEVFTAFVAGCQTEGSQTVDEINENRIDAKASDSYPAEAGAIRRQLFDNPKDTNLLTRLAMVYMGASDFPLARVIMSHVLELKPKNSTAEAILATILLHMNDTEGAQAGYKQALSHNAREATALWGLAAMYKHFGFENKYETTIARAKSAGQPSVSHPWMNGL